MVLHNAIGAIFIGSLLSTTLYGVSCAQIYYYFGHHKKDPWYLKLLVLAVWASNAAHQCLISHTTYTYAITNYGNVAMVNALIPTLLIQFLFTAFTALMTQIFFAFHVWQKSDKNRILTGIMLAIALTGFVTTVVYAVQGLQVKTFEQLNAYKYLIWIANIFSAIPNLYITGAACHLTPWKKSTDSDAFIINAVVFFLETGLPFTVFSIIMMVMGIALRDSMVYVSFLFILSRLYLNCMLFVLNGRKGSKGAAGSQNEKPSISRQRSRLQLRSDGRRTPGNITIHIDTVQEFTQDTGSPLDDPFKNSMHTQDTDLNVQHVDREGPRSNTTGVNIQDYSKMRQ